MRLLFPDRAQAERQVGCDVPRSVRADALTELARDAAEDLLCIPLSRKASLPSEPAEADVTILGGLSRVSRQRRSVSTLSQQHADPIVPAHRAGDIRNAPQS